MKFITGALLFLLTIPGLAAPKPTNFEFIEIPNATVRPKGINNAGDISGDYYGAQSFGGFILKAATKELITLSVPNALRTNAGGIDEEGRVTGTFLDYECPGPCDYQTKSFVYQNGQYTTLTYPGAYSTDAVDIDQGRVVGAFSDGLYRHGFLYDNGQWTQLDYPGNIITFATGISGNRIVGTTQSIDQQHGFVYLIAEKTWQEIRFPQPGDRTALAAVSANAIIGGALTSPCGFEPFILIRDKFFTLDLPQTQIAAINDAGYLVGDFGLERGFVAKASAFTLRK